MIVSASYRTDIPAFFADWFRARLAGGGAAIVENPYGGPDTRVALAAPDCDGFVFWTRNIAPFRGALADVAERGLPFVVQLTVTGYPRALDAHTLRAAETTAQIRALARDWGPRAAVWRYDPVLLTSLTPAGWHRENFARLARALAGAVDECTVSFAQIYRKTGRRLKAAAAARDFTWRDPGDEEKIELLQRLAEIAADHGMALTVCSQPGLAVPPLAAARCIDADRLSDVADRAIAARRKGNRPGCLCAESRDIGAYDTCAHGCVYCYAVSDHDKAAARIRATAADREIA